MRQPVGILNVFNTLNLKQIFWKTKTFFEKLENQFLDGNTRIENSSSQYKTAILEANDETNRTISSKWTYRKEWSFARNYFISLEILEILKSVDLMYVPIIQMSLLIFFVSAVILFEDAFSLRLSLNV